MKEMYKSSWIKLFILIVFIIQLILFCSCERLNVSSSSDFRYDFDNGEAIITGYQGTELDIVVPSEIDGRPVVRIEDGAFRKYDLNSITFQEGVRELGNNVFANCENMKKVTLPQSLEVIGEYTFEDCISLTDINLSDGLCTLSNGAFYGCSSLEIIKIPSGITEIGQDCFSECKSLKTVEIFSVLVESESKYLTTIGKNAFSGCTSLTNINLPNTVKKVRENAFKDCSSLDSIGSEIDLNNIGVEKDAFLNTKFENSCEFSILDGTLVNYNGSKKDVVVPDNVVTIGEKAFAGNKEIVSVKMSENVTDVSAYAFMDCENLKKITLSSNISFIGKGAFLRSGIDEISLPRNISKIEALTFANTDIKNIEILGNIKEISMGAFMDCKKLENVNISNGLQRIAEVSFANCEMLNSITIPDSVEFIGELALGTKATTLDNKEAITFNCDGIITCLVYDSDFIIYGEEDTTASEYALEHHLKYIDVDKTNSEKTSYIYYKDVYGWSKVYACFYVGEEPSGKEVVANSQEMESLGNNIYRVSLPEYKATDVIFSNGKDQFIAALEVIPGEGYIYDSGSYKWSEYK